VVTRMLDPHPNLTQPVIIGLGWLYLLLFAMNCVWTWRSARTDKQVTILGNQVPNAALWAMYSSVLLMVAVAHLTSHSNPDAFLIRMPAVVKNIVNMFADPISYFTLSVLLFVVTITLRRWLVRLEVAWTLLNLVILFFTLSLTDWNFRQIVGKPDNVPIVAMLFIVGFFTWLYFKQAVVNDDRTEQGLPPLGKENNDKVLVWPDLVYAELICMILFTALLIAWGIALQAPLEEPASSVKTPNPSKAPWYFLGLQEMLVYYDPWLAGVVLPSIILGGLMAVPYIDFNPKGNGYFTFTERKFAVTTFMFGFLPLWVAMIILGTFLRGPNWNFFGIYEYWDVHKLEALNNVNLSEYVWVLSPLSSIFGGLPTAASDASELTKLGYIALRESTGILALGFYFLAMPPLLAATVFRSFYEKMGFIRFMVLANLFLWMAALPIKMVLRWSVDLKYIVAIPEYFLNF
ncbi:MAG: hypothetical protein ABGZ17_04815, partial [Planctomycetaceae bacterium]